MIVSARTMCALGAWQNDAMIYGMKT